MGDIVSYRRTAAIHLAMARLAGGDGGGADRSSTPEEPGLAAMKEVRDGLRRVEAHLGPELLQQFVEEVREWVEGTEAEASEGDDAEPEVSSSQETGGPELPFYTTSLTDIYQGFFVAKSTRLQNQDMKGLKDIFHEAEDAIMVYEALQLCRALLYAYASENDVRGFRWLHKKEICTEAEGRRMYVSAYNYREVEFVKRYVINRESLDETIFATKPYRFEIFREARNTVRCVHDSTDTASRSGGNCAFDIVHFIVRKSAARPARTADSEFGKLVDYAKVLATAPKEVLLLVIDEFKATNTIYRGGPTLELHSQMVPYLMHLYKRVGAIKKLVDGGLYVLMRVIVAENHEAGHGQGRRQMKMSWVMLSPAVVQKLSDRV